MSVKRSVSEDMYDAAPQRLRDMVKAGLPEPQCPVVERTLVGSMSILRRHREPWVRFLLMVCLARWTMHSECIEGHEKGTYVALVRSSVTEHGIAYGARALG